MLKRGMSPLIATVLLVAFSVALGALVMNFAQTSAQDFTEQTENLIETGLRCTLDLPIRLLDKRDELLICTNRTGSNNLEFILENQGSSAASGMRVVALDYIDNVKSIDVLIPIMGHSVVKYNVSMLLANDGRNIVFPLTKVEITPIIATANGIALCNENRIEIEDISECD